MSELNFTHSNGNKVKLTTPDTLAANKTFKLPGTDGSGGQVLQTDGSGALSFASQAPSHRRLNYNGAMLVNQRGNKTGATATGYHANDRYYTQMQDNDSGTWSVTQAADVPDGYGFKYSLEYGCTSTSNNANRYLMTVYRMEGNDSQVFNYGTANAKTVTLSFWIKCSKAGNFQVNFENEQNPDVGYQVQQTISSAGTWEKKVVTIPGDTTKAFTFGAQKAMCFDIVYSAFGSYASGTPSAAWSTLANEQRGGHCNMDLFDSTSNYVKITGVQFELGDHATDFEHIPYCDELQRCKRYYQTASYTTLMGSASGAVSTPRILFEVEMRAIPTSVETAYTSNGNGSFRNQNNGSIITGHTTFNYYINGFDCRGSSGSANIIYSSTYKAEAEI